MGGAGALLLGAANSLGGAGALLLGATSSFGDEGAVVLGVCSSRGLALISIVMPWEKCSVQKLKLCSKMGIFINKFKKF